MSEGGRCFAVNSAGGVKHLNGVENACRRRRRTKLISLPFFLSSFSSIPISHYFRRVNCEELDLCVSIMLRDLMLFLWKMPQENDANLKSNVYLVALSTNFGGPLCGPHPQLCVALCERVSEGGEESEVTRKGEPRWGKCIHAVMAAANRGMLRTGHLPFSSFVSSPL